MNNEYDLIVVGGGAAGMMAAISAKRARSDLKVLIVDRTFSLGRKILVCGAGRCNVTNVNLTENPAIHYYGASQEFINSVLNQFGKNEIEKFFSELGVSLYVERKTDVGKMFPVTDQAATITEMLLDELQRLGIQVTLNTSVEKIIPGEYKARNKRGFKILTSEQTFLARKVIIAAGGRTYPALGADGSGYTLAESLGHKIIQPVPAALPLVSNNQLSHLLQGVKLDLEVTSIINGRKIKTTSDNVMFTKYGFSGPAILNISREYSIFFNRQNGEKAELLINFMIGHTYESARIFFAERWEKRPTQTLERSLFGLFPNKVPRVILTFAGIDYNRQVGKLSPEEREKIINLLTNLKVDVTGTRGWNEAEFTAGGVSTSEIDENTMQSKLLPGLYFAGEIMDVDGDVGGYNLSWSWSSGNLAGKLKE